MGSFKECILSQSDELQRALLSNTIVDIVKCISTDQGYVVPNVPTFLADNGYIVLELKTGESVGFFCQDELNAITCWFEKTIKGTYDPVSYYEKDEELTLLRVSSLEKSRLQGLLNHRIDSIHIVKQLRYQHPKLADSPNETGLLIGIENGNYLLLSHYMFNHEAPHDFEIRFFDTMPQFDPDEYILIKVEE